MNMLGLLQLSRGRRLIFLFLAIMAWGWAWAPSFAVANSVPLRPSFAQDKITLRSQDGVTRTLRVELARTPHEVSYGLMYIPDMPGTDGMLFRLPGLGRYSFWMKNTVMPLDIIFLDEKGAVVNQYNNTTPFSTDYLFSAGAALMVLEVKAGMAKKWGIGKGATITPPPGFLP